MDATTTTMISDVVSSLTADVQTVVSTHFPTILSVLFGVIAVMVIFYFVSRIFRKVAR